MENPNFQDFLDRMRDPAAADLVRSVRRFIADLSAKLPDPETDSKSVQDFMTSMELTFKDHPVWAGATSEELESAGEGLEKYLMTRLFSRTFAPTAEEREHDQMIFEKISLLQQFVRPEHLDIPPKFQNESSWLLAQKELQNINTYKAPRDKLVSILNCSKVIRNVFMATNENPPGADEFLPVLIYITLKANPPQLYSNLLYIQRYRHHSRLVSEAAYFYTNLVSAESFIANLDAKSISMDEKEFERKMQYARESLDGHGHAPELPSEQTHVEPNKTSEIQGPPSQSRSIAGIGAMASISLPKLQADGSSAVLEADKAGHLAREFPFLYAKVGDLQVEDIESLLNDYKELVLKYYALCKAVESITPVKHASGNLKSSNLAGAIDGRGEESLANASPQKEKPTDMDHLTAELTESRGTETGDQNDMSTSNDVFSGLSIHDNSEKTIDITAGSNTEVRFHASYQQSAERMEESISSGEALKQASQDIVNQAEMESSKHEV